MNTTEMLLNLWDQAEAVRLAATRDRETLDAMLHEQCLILRQRLKFQEAEAAVQETWIEIEKSHHVRELAEWLHAIEQSGITLPDFSIVLAHAGRSSFDEMLATMRKGKNPNAQN